MCPKSLIRSPPPSLSRIWKNIHPCMTAQMLIRKLETGHHWCDLEEDGCRQRWESILWWFWRDCEEWAAASWSFWSLSATSWNVGAVYENSFTKDRRAVLTKKLLSWIDINYFVILLGHTFLVFNSLHYSWTECNFNYFFFHQTFTWIYSNDKKRNF